MLIMDATFETGRAYAEMVKELNRILGHARFVERSPEAAKKTEDTSSEEPSETPPAVKNVREKH